MPISSLANICSTSSGVTRWLANERTVTMPTKADRPNMVERNLIQAMRDGTALRGTAQRLAREARASKNVTIRMAEADLDLARKQAEAKGLPHQTDIKSVLHEALVKRQRRQTS
jgi:predicted DNA binding CopG/RHH family protein